MRLPTLEESELDPPQRAVLDALRDSPRARQQPVGLHGPFGVWVRAPRLGGEVAALGAAVRYGSTLPANVREIAICTVGVHYRAKFEFAAHAPLARAAGVDADALEAIRGGRDPGLDGTEDIAWRVARQLLAAHHLDDALYAEAQALLGEEALIELVTTVGYYCLVSLTLNAFEVPLEAGMADPFPE